MDPERIRVVLRPRSDWESVDLGLRLAQHHASLLYRAWLLASLPWAVVICGICLWGGQPLLAFLLFWWSKPLYERVLLHLLSRLVFDDRPRRGELLPIALTTPFTAAWLRALTIGRFELARSFNLPVWQLENLRGAPRRRRAAVLHLGAGGTGLALTLCTFATVWLLFLSLTALVMSVLVSDIVVLDPGSLAAYLGELVAAVVYGGKLTQAACFALFYLCEGFVSAFYVAAGFCLYLNRRTHLEAWDIELQFRRAARRRGGTTTGATLAGLACIALTAAFCVSPAGASDAAGSTAHATAGGRIVYDDPAAEDMRAADERRVAIRARIDAILSDDMFGRFETRRIWQRRDVADDDGDDDAPAETPAWLSFIGSLFASLTELVLWCGVLALLILAYLYRRRWLPLLRAAGHGATPAPEPSAGGLLMRSAEMPEDVPAAALALWQEGQRAHAASLLYRALLTRLDQRHELGVHSGDTEADCLRLVRRAADSQTVSYFSSVTQSWQSTAYAHRAPSSGDFAALCARWYELPGGAP